MEILQELTFQRRIMDFVEETLKEIDGLGAWHSHNCDLWSEDGASLRGCNCGLKDFIKQKLLELQQRDIEIVESEREPISKIQSIMHKKGLNGKALSKEVYPRTVKNKTIDTIITKMKGNYE